MLLVSIKQSLLNLPRWIKRSAVIFYDLVVCILSVWIAIGLLLDQWGVLEGSHWWVVTIAIGFSFPLFITFGLYRAIFRFNGSNALSSIVQLFIIYTCLFFGVFTIIGVENVSRSIGLIQPLLLFIGIASSRYFIRIWLGSINNFQRSSHKETSQTLIFGAGSIGRQLAFSLSINKEMLVKGFIDDDKNLQGNTINGVPVYDSVNIKNLITRLKITDVFLAIPLANKIRRNEFIDSLKGCGVRIRKPQGFLNMNFSQLSDSNLHDLDMRDLLGRKVISPDVDLMEKNIRDRVVLVTGAGGSIGSELCRQVMKFSPRALVFLDISEYGLYEIYEELKKINTLPEDNGAIQYVSEDIHSNSSEAPQLKLIPYLASVRDTEQMLKIFTTHKPATVFHAAAYKHVPLVEENPSESIRNNVFGTLTCAQIAAQTGVSHFILISTDKAVRPTSVMGASKRIAELTLQAMAERVAKEGYSIKFLMVRFGNVLGSSGSVAPLFSAQIKSGGPITLTHPEVTRYFMTIPEAAELVIQSSAMATGGDVFILDMGQPVRIYDLAVKMINLSGLMVKDELNPHGDIEIKVTGLRQGEKLFEELLISGDLEPTFHPKIMKAYEEFFHWDELELELKNLDLTLQSFDSHMIRMSLKKLVPDYQLNKDKNGLPYPT
jgi:FlaA1/EpsC-like NDP-sugar epimerase